MAGETSLTIVGRLTADPELRYTQSGLPVANFTVASNARIFDRTTSEWKDGEPLFLRGSLWRDYAEHVAASLHKGDHVIVTGTLEQRAYETKPTDGSAPERRTAYELRVEHIGPVLQYARCQVQRIIKDPVAVGGGEQNSANGWNVPATAGAPVAASAGAEAPF